MSWFSRREESSEEYPPITDGNRVFPDEHEIEIIPDMVDDGVYHVHLPAWFTGEEKEDGWPPIEG